MKKDGRKGFVDISYKDDGFSNRGRIIKGLPVKYLSMLQET